MTHYVERGRKEFAVTCEATGDTMRGCAGRGPWGTSETEARELAAEKEASDDKDIYAPSP